MIVYYNFVKYNKEIQTLWAELKQWAKYRPVPANLQTDFIHNQVLLLLSFSLLHSPRFDFEDPPKPDST